MKSRMNETISESFCIELSCFKILCILRPECFHPPNECGFVSANHIMCNLLQFPIWFYPWILQKISINCGNLMSLADLHWNIVEILNNQFHSISSIDHGIVRLWISFLPHCMKERSIVFDSFLEDVFWRENIARDSVLSHKYSPLGIRTFLSEEGGIKDEDRGSIRGDLWIYTDRAPFLDENTSSIFLWIVRTE